MGAWRSNLALPIALRKLEPKRLGGGSVQRRFRCLQPQGGKTSQRKSKSRVREGRRPGSGTRTSLLGDAPLGGPHREPRRNRRVQWSRHVRRCIPNAARPPPRNKALARVARWRSDAQGLSPRSWCRLSRSGFSGPPPRYSSPRCRTAASSPERDASRPLRHPSRAGRTSEAHG